MKFHFVRHTSVAVPKGICYGQSDVPLRDTFEKEAVEVKHKLDRLQFDYVYASPLSRCRRLAEFCVGTQTISYDDRLKEMNYGAWEMKDWNKLDFSAWEEDWVYNAVPQGESFYAQYQRLAAFVDELLLKHEPSDQLVLFTHGGILACATAYFEGIPLQDSFVRKAAYGAVFSYTK